MGVHDDQKRKEGECQEMSWSRGKVGHKEEKDEVKYVAAVNKVKFEIGGEKEVQTKPEDLERRGREKGSERG